jgi:hypothetical protein
MNDAEGINFKVSIPTDRGGSNAKIARSMSLRHNNPNLEDIIRFIDGLPITSGDKKILKKSAEKVPHGALANFRSNYSNYLNKEVRS